MLAAATASNSTGNWTAPDINGPCTPYWFSTKAEATDCINAWVAEYNYTVAFEGGTNVVQIPNGYVIGYLYYYSPHPNLQSAIVEYLCNENAYWDGATHQCMAAGTIYPTKNLGKPCNCAGDPINLGTGNEYRDVEDVSLSGLSFHRYYNSLDAVASSHIGAHWRHSFDRSLAYLSSSTAPMVTVFRPDGLRVTFTLQNGQWTTDLDIADRLISQANAAGAITGWSYFDASTRDQEGLRCEWQLALDCRYEWANHYPELQHSFYPGECCAIAWVVADSD